MILQPQNEINNNCSKIINTNIEVMSIKLILIFLVIYL